MQYIAAYRRQATTADAVESNDCIATDPGSALRQSDD
jgi:hypothetical protein